MCGICVSLSFRVSSAANLRQSFAIVKNLVTRIKRRGPNHFQNVSFSFYNILDICLTSSVLQLRGSSLSQQPFTDGSGNYLLWNGEIFDGDMYEESQSDTKVLSEKLFNAKDPSEVIPIIASVKGPFAFVFYQNNGLLWFGRDIFGRRSLLWKADSKSFHLCSLSNLEEEWNELCTEGVFCLDLKQSITKKCCIINLYPWSSTPSGLILAYQENKIVLPNVEMFIMSQLSLQNPISKPVNKSLPSEEDLKMFEFPDLSFENDQVYKDLFPRLLDVLVFKETVSQFEEALSKAVEKRVKNHQHVCKNCYDSKNNTCKDFCGHSSMGVLFSGGLDSIVITCLADRFLPENEPIDLINVAFATNRSLTYLNSCERHTAFNTPDRLTGRNGLKILQNVCPKRTWNFVEVNVSEEKLVTKRKDVIRHLLTPSCTVLDDSIGCAIWFAARGKGLIMTDERCKGYISPARVLLVGMGADEQLGGYSRHRAKFNAFGWDGIVKELCMELDRIGSRNLGRDDRTVADNGVESRYPFLDENVVSFLNDVPVWLKMNLKFPRGIGEKLLLRLLAFKLGLIEASGLPKRAIQFGSRIARIENSKERGADLCERILLLDDC
ncbi:asparagine synthetase domain-containing protein 1 [Trichonephila clavata]|uniref:Asparagine synthetase domain-containing protein 1 n=1 Tax=Trichonephila clavata TaxID=2740835 RepID=A0A8X6GKQ5_TRICU|nr:asparagine synthetase domain-containing protein 1 [Trichonephila clavata]